MTNATVIRPAPAPTWSAPVAHDLGCQACGHAAHRYLPCSPTCRCQPPPAPGSVPLAP